MKCFVIAAVLGMMTMVTLSSGAEACCGKRLGCGRGYHHRQRSCSTCGGREGFFHRCRQQRTCQSECREQPGMVCRLALVCAPAMIGQPPTQMMYQQAQQPMVYST